MEVTIEFLFFKIACLNPCPGFLESCDVTVTKTLKTTKKRYHHFPQLFEISYGQKVAEKRGQKSKDF